jgi:hypothetical protein
LGTLRKSLTPITSIPSAGVCIDAVLHRHYTLFGLPGEGQYRRAPTPRNPQAQSDHFGVLNHSIVPFLHVNRPGGMRPPARKYGSCADRRARARGESTRSSEMKPVRAPSRGSLRDGVEARSGRGEKPRRRTNPQARGLFA